MEQLEMAKEENFIGIVDKAEETIMKKLKSANELIADIKNQMVHGTDMISTAQIQDWAIIIPIICQDLTPSKEAFALTKSLWDIDLRCAAAKNILELNKKKTEIEQLNRIAGTEGEQKKAIMDYMRNMLGGVQDSLQSLNSTLKKILEARIRGREDK